MSSFAEGVRAAMREDPDVILVGEMRDAETISMAMTAAETGHLVLGTLHTTGAVEDHRPHHRRAAHRGARTDQEFPVAEPVSRDNPDAGQDRRPAHAQGHLRNHGDDGAIAKLIQTDQTHQIPEPDADRKDLGMQLLDQALLDALSAKEIDPDDAVTYANDRRPFQQYVTDTALMPKLEVTSPTAAASGGTG